MAKVRWATLVGLLGAGGALLAALLDRELKTPLGRTLAPLFSLVGRSTQDIDRMLSHVLPLGDIDEQMLGEAIEARCRGGWQSQTADADYANALLADLVASKQRPFGYRAYVIAGLPNACALPGGIVLVTSELFRLFTTEAQLVSVLGHEVGHIECGHCFAAAKFAMLSRKLGGAALGEIADAIYRTLVAISFSKTQEEEADEYAYQTLLASRYDPAAMGGAFAVLQDYQAGAERGGNAIDPLRDYFRSHPPIELRSENYRERARRWRVDHVGESMYVGARNYRERCPRSRRAYAPEWAE